MSSVRNSPISTTRAIKAFDAAIQDRRLSQKDVTQAIKPYASLLAKPGVYQDRVKAVVNGTSDQFVAIAPTVKARLERLLTPSPADARAAFDAATANGHLSAADVRTALEPYVELLRAPGAYRDAVSALVQGRTDRHVTLSPAARQFFQREHLL